MDTELRISSPINSATNALITTTPSVDTVIQHLFNQYLEIHPNLNNKSNSTILNNENNIENNQDIIEENNENIKIKSWFNLRTIPIIGKFLPEIDDKTKIINELLEFQKSTTNYKDWVNCSLKLDELLGNNTWKSDPQSDIYDYNLIYNHLTLMKNARLNNNFKLLLYYIRTNWVRNLGNMGDSNLYRHSYVGTKKLIEEYLNECQLSLNYLVENNQNYDNDSKNKLNDRYLLGMLIQTRKNIGRTALVLSGGSTFGIFHIGVLATLFEANLLPRIISGSSAGSIMASILCCHTNDETIELLETIASRNFNIFDITDRDSTITSKFRNVLMFLGHLIKYGTIFDIEGLQETMIGFLGDLTFREAYNRTGKILNITVSPASLHEQTRLLNYITAPNCLIWSAVCASCSLPGVFPSSSVYEKNTKTNEIHEWNNDESMKFVDGSVDNDLPITRLSEMFNVDHIIAVQVNPHVVPILKVSVSNIGGEVENDISYKLKHLLNNVYDFVSSEAIHYLQLMSELDISKNLSNRIISILSQHYSGDITILPEYKVTDFIKLFENPNPEFLLDFICRGAKASWPKISIIHNHCSVEFLLDKAITTLRGRIITTSNYRITQSGEDFNHNSTNSSIKRSQSYYKPRHNLHNSTAFQNAPSLLNNNQDNQSAPNTPIKTYQRPQGVQRHNTTSNTTSSHRRNSVRSKRNSMSATDIEKISHNNNSNGITTPKKSIIPKGTSSTTLSQLNHSYNTDDSNDSIIGRQKIRKTRSSGNFDNNYNNNRVILGSSETSNTNSSKSFGNNNQKLEKINLPSSSRSLKNSYIGLNRLKDTATQNELQQQQKQHQQDLIKKLETVKKKSILKNSNNISSNGISQNQIQFYDNSEDDETAGILYNQEDTSEDEEIDNENENEKTLKDTLETTANETKDEKQDEKQDNDKETNNKEGDVSTVTFESIKMEPCTDSLVDDINAYYGNK
ncbi:TGL5 [Candida jiufengensis]|uniref:TGL5 n=1 Tax=Candida jiufengensis TaxID=497108 RepID=UPI002225469B|nr:TGL5 [Candida jiufengensis]KAI5953211.1 TGL5 [Candida jiufengensis]